jgi:hypothetical protein
MRTSRSRCPACGRREKRSSEANRRYWQLVSVIAETVKPGGAAYGVNAWHLWLKSRFLGCTDTKLPNGAVLTEPNSSADLDADEFSDFMTAVEAWAAERGAFLSE